LLIAPQHEILTDVLEGRLADLTRTGDGA
jgi:hypothetical protein